MMRNPQINFLGQIVPLLVMSVIKIIVNSDLKKLIIKTFDYTTFSYLFRIAF